MSNTKKLGNLGEKIAENYLKKKGYEILDKNFLEREAFGPARGEIDIVAKNGGVISFIEVKTLRLADDGPFWPEAKVDFQKQRKIINTAQSWLMKKKIPLDSQWQIDVIAITIDSRLKKAKVRHFQNI